MAILLTGPACGAIIVVEEGQKIQEVIDSAVPGDVIEVEGGRYFENLNVTKPWFFTASTTLWWTQEA